MCIPTYKGALKKPRDMEKDWLELINGGPKKTLWFLGKDKTKEQKCDSRHPNLIKSLGAAANKKQITRQLVLYRQSKT